MKTFNFYNLRKICILWACFHNELPNMFTGCSWAKLFIRTIWTIFDTIANVTAEYLVPTTTFTVKHLEMGTEHVWQLHFS